MIVLSSMERCRPRHPHPEASQGGIREIAMTRPTIALTAPPRLSVAPGRKETTTILLKLDALP